MSTASIDSQLYDYFESANLDIREIKTINYDGKITRVPRADEIDSNKKSGWYKVSQNADGSTVAVAGYYKGDTNYKSPAHVINPDRSNSKVARLTPEQIASREREIAMRQAATREAREKEKLQTSKNADVRLKQDLVPITKENMPEYLIKKGIEANGALYDQKHDALAIPYYSLGKDNKPVIAQIQSIYKNKNEDGTESFKKMFMRGTALDNAYHPMGDKRNEDKLVFISESYSTGASVAQSTNAYVLAAYSSTTVPSLAKQVHDSVPPYFTVVASVDADPAGINAAAKAKELTSGIEPIPNFEEYEHLISGWKESEALAHPNREPREPETWGELLTIAGADEAFKQLREHIGVEFVVPDFKGYETQVAQWMENNNSQDPPTDFNDLMQIAGKNAVQTQISSVVTPLVQEAMADKRLQALIEYENVLYQENNALNNDNRSTQTEYTQSMES